jgi:hypothetical protein
MSQLIALDSEAEAFRYHTAERGRAFVPQLRDAAELLLGEAGRPGPIIAAGRVLRTTLAPTMKRP